MKHRIWYDRQADIIRVRLVGEVTRGFMDEMLESSRDSDCRNIMVDYSQSILQKEKPGESFTSFDYGENSGVFFKHAAIGASPMTRGMAVLVSFLINLSKSSRFFTAEDDAVEWLKEILQ